MHLIKTTIQVCLRTVLNHHHCIVTTTCTFCYHHHNHHTCQCPVWVHSSTTRYTIHWHRAALACLPWRGPGLGSTSPARSRSSRRKTQGLASRPQSCWDAARYLYLQKHMCQHNSNLFGHALTMLSVDGHGIPNTTHFVVTIICRLSGHCTKILLNVCIFLHWEERSLLPTHIWKRKVNQSVIQTHKVGTLIVF